MLHLMIKHCQMSRLQKKFKSTAFLEESVVDDMTKYLLSFLKFRNSLLCSENYTIRPHPEPL